jgi:hypothetical protein
MPQKSWRFAAVLRGSNPSAFLRYTYFLRVFL